MSVPVLTIGIATAAAAIGLAVPASVLTSTPVTPVAQSVVLAGGHHDDDYWYHHRDHDHNRNDDHYHYNRNDHNYNYSRNDHNDIRYDHRGDRGLIVLHDLL
jgi:hypothetical protein